MKITISLVTWGLAAVQAATVSRPSVTPSNVAPLLALNNATISADIIDPRFHVSPTFGAGFISVNPTLMNILYFMADMAYRDHNELVAPVTWSDPSFPEIQIVTDDTHQAKYLLWGIFDGIQYMVKYNRFHETLLTLTWEKEVVGKIWILLAKPGLSLASGNATSNSTRGSNLPPSGYNGTRIEEVAAGSVAASSTTSLGANFQVGIMPLPNGGPLTRFDVFFVCYAGLVHLSQAKPDTQMQDFKSGSPLGNVFVYMYRWRPSLKVIDAIQVMVYIPGALITAGQGFREIIFRLKMDSSLALEGTINKGNVLTSFK